MVHPQSARLLASTSPDGRRRYVHPVFDLAWPSLCRLPSLPNREVQTYARSRLTLIGDHYIGTARPVDGRPSYLPRPSFPLSVRLSSPSPLQLVCQSTSSLCVHRRCCRRHFRLPAQRLPRFRLRVRLPTFSESAWSHWAASLSFLAVVAAETRSRHSWSCRASCRLILRIYSTSVSAAVFVRSRCPSTPPSSPRSPRALSSSVESRIDPALLILIVAPGYTS